MASHAFGSILSAMAGLDSSPDALTPCDVMFSIRYVVTCKCCVDVKSGRGWKSIQCRSAEHDPAHQFSAAFNCSTYPSHSTTYALLPRRHVHHAAYEHGPTLLKNVEWLCFSVELEVSILTPSTYLLILISIFVSIFTKCAASSKICLYILLMSSLPEHSKGTRVYSRARRWRGRQTHQKPIVPQRLEGAAHSGSPATSHTGPV